MGIDGYVHGGDDFTGICTYPQTHRVINSKYVWLFFFFNVSLISIKWLKTYYINLCLVSGRYHKSQAIYLESKDNQKLSCVISSVGANEVGAELPPPSGEQSVTNLQYRCYQERTVESCVMCGLGSQSALPDRNCMETKYPRKSLTLLD